MMTQLYLPKQLLTTGLSVLARRSVQKWPVSKERHPQMEPVSKQGRVQAVSELLQVSLTHSGSAGRFRFLQPAGEAILLEFFCSVHSTCLVWSDSSGRSSLNVVSLPPNRSAVPWKEKTLCWYLAPVIMLFGKTGLPWLHQNSIFRRA